MSSLRDNLAAMVAETPVYGDLDRAIQRAERKRQHLIAVGMGAAAVAVLVLIVGGVAVNRARVEEPRPAAPTTTDTSVPAVGALDDGPVTPGRYRYVIHDTCDPRLGCPAEAKPQLPDIAVTVPAGWRASNEFHLIEPSATGTRAPHGAGLVLGWTTFHVGLYSEPCHAAGDSAPDVPVGPSVDDFIDAVTGHPLLDVTDPTSIELGGHPGRFITLKGPADIERCGEWRPWDPSPYVQGPSNRWDLWVMDVDGVRVLVLAGYYPGTPGIIRAELRDMVDSIEFLPSTTGR